MLSANVELLLKYFKQNHNVILHPVSLCEGILKVFPKNAALLAPVLQKTDYAPLTRIELIKDDLLNNHGFDIYLNDDDDDE